MRTLVALAFALCPAACFAQEKKDEKKPTLAIGDKPPPLKVTKWVQGDAVAGFEAGKVYVVEFWATWCGPCIRAMPHLAELQAAHAADGLVVVGLTTKDDNGNNAETVAKFVAKNGKKFTYRFAYCEDQDTDKAYMEASGQGGIPCSFVVGKDGTLAYIGHPSNLDDVLPKVLAGTWKGKADADAVAKANDERDAILDGGEKDPAAALAKLAAFEKDHPTAAKNEQVMIRKFIFQLKAGKFDEAKAHGEAIVAAGTAKKRAEPCSYVGLILANKEFNPDKKLFDLAVAATDAALKIDATDVRMALAVMDVYLAAGDRAKAAEAGKKALAAAESEDEKKEIQQFVDDKMKAGEKK